jgi:hypothetical protein
MAEAPADAISDEERSDILVVRAAPDVNVDEASPWKVARGLPVELQVNADGEVAVGLAGSVQRISVRRALDESTPTALGGVVTRTFARRGVNPLWFARGADVEELLLIDSGDDEIVYDIDLPEGSSLAQPIPGLVEVREKGYATLRMRFDRAWDPRGGAPRITPTIEDGVRVRVSVESDTWPVLVDPTWQSAGTMHTGRYAHTTTLLDNGDVLIAGGQSNVVFDTAEVYHLDDEGEGSFTVVQMTQARASHTATLLSNGKVLLTGSDGFNGGEAGNEHLASAELFDPKADPPPGKFAPTVSMATLRAFHTATLLQTGDVLVVGTSSAFPAEIYVVALDTFVAVGEPVGCGREFGAATRLLDGTVLITGGNSCSGPGSVSSAEIYDPATKTFHPAPGTGMTVPRQCHTSTLLPSGEVLITGGYAETQVGGSGDSAEIYTPGVGFSPAGKMRMPRARHIAERLPDGKVLLVGGNNLANWCDLCDPDLHTFSATKDASANHTWGAGTKLGLGRVFVAGGGTQVVKEAEVFIPGSLGLPCESADVCEPGFSCIDGVCCESACDETCMACSRASKGYGKDGVCEPVRVGFDPHLDCVVGKVDGSASCPNNGFCSKQGTCEFPCGNVEGRACRQADSCQQDGCTSSVDCLSGYRCSADRECVRVESAPAAPPPEAVLCSTSPAGGASPWGASTWLLAFSAFAARWRRWNQQ